MSVTEDLTRNDYSHLCLNTEVNTVGGGEGEMKKKIVKIH